MYFLEKKYLLLFCVAISIAFFQKQAFAFTCDDGIANVQDFGAVGDGVENDSPSVQNALNCIKNKSDVFGVLYFPTGKYKFNNVVGLSSLGIASIKIKGDGARLSQLWSNNTSGVFTFQSDNRTSRLVVEDIGFIAYRANGHSGTAVNFTLPVGGDRHERSLEVKDVEIRGPNFDRGFFKNGIIGTGVHRALIDNVLMTGPWGSENSHSVRSDNCYYLIDSYSPTIMNSACWSSINGIHLRAQTLLPTVGTLPEGLFIANNKIVHVENGIRVDNSVGMSIHQEPEGFIKDNHINAENNGIWLRGKKFVFIRDNLMFRVKYNTIPGETAEFYSDILLDASSDCIVSNNIFHSPLADNEWIGINRAAVRIWTPLEGTDNVSSGNIIDGNIFKRRVMFKGNDHPGSHAVWVQSRSKNNIIRELPANAIVTIAQGTNTTIQ